MGLESMCSFAGVHVPPCGVINRKPRARTTKRLADTREDHGDRLLEQMALWCLDSLRWRALGWPLKSGVCKEFVDLGSDLAMLIYKVNESRTCSLKTSRRLEKHNSER